MFFDHADLRGCRTQWPRPPPCTSEPSPPTDQRCNVHSVLHAFQLVDNRIVLFDPVLPLLEAVQAAAHAGFHAQDLDQKAHRSRTRFWLVSFHEFAPQFEALSCLALLRTRESSSFHQYDEEAEKCFPVGLHACIEHCSRRAAASISSLGSNAPQ